MNLLAPLLLGLVPAPQADLPVVLDHRERAALEGRLLQERLDEVVPMLMRREGIDMWILIAREYNEDPVLETMLPPTWMAARRRTMLVFFDPVGDAAVERFAVSRYAVGEHFESAWNKEEQPDQWARLAELVRERDPQRIAVNVSETFALADGLSHAEHGALRTALGEELAGRLVSGELLSIGWLETRTPSEMELYPTLGRIAHEIIAEGLSDRAVQPGHTTTADLEWWYREAITDARLETWFHPSVSLQRAETGGHSGSFASEEGSRTIHRGDLVHVDFGITYLGLNTDTQQHAYVLREGESEPPAGLVAGLRAGNRLQEILNSHFAVGRSGNEVLARSREQAEAEGLAPSIYTHPLGMHGHGAGATIGLWDQQGGVPGRGDYPVQADTAWSIELNVTVAIPEWDGQEIRVMLEEDAFFDGEAVSWIDGRQEELLLIR